MIHPEYYDSTWVLGVIDATLERFNTSLDLELLNLGIDETDSAGPVGERAIAHRLALHLEAEFRSRKLSDSASVTVDCEYNRHRKAVKALSVEKKLKKRVKKAKRSLRKDPLRRGWYAFSVFPDIILHQRGIDDANVLVVEVKRSSNTIDLDYDDLKLELFTRTGDYGYAYTLGAAVVAGDHGASEVRRLTRGALYYKGAIFRAVE